MKKVIHCLIVTCLLTAFGFLLCVSASAQTRLFYDTNLVVVRVGNGTQTLSTAGNSIFLDQFTTNGTLVNTLAVPDTGASALVLSGNTFVDGFLTRSADRRLLTLAAYSRAVGTSGALPSSSTVPRAVLNIDAFGNLQQPAVTTTDFNALTWRCAVTDGTNNHWGVGSGGGVVYLGNASPKAVIESAKANCRTLEIINNSLYMSSAAANQADGLTGIYKFTGYPKATTALPAPTIFTNTFNSTSSRGISDFAVNPFNTIIYFADGRDYTALEGGIQRWDYDNVNGVWVNSYHLTNGLPGDELQSIAVDWTGAAPVVYTTTIGTSATNRTKLLRVTDVGPNSLFTTLATSGANQVYRGLKFGPTIGAPIILTQPTNQFTVTGSNVTFVVTASSATPVGYQWLLNGGNLLDATNAALNLTNIQFSDTGTYQLVATNSSGTATSLPATLTLVTNPPTITSFTTNALVQVGGTATLTANASSPLSITYQWQFNGVSIAGATTSRLTIANSQITNAGTYWIYATNDYSFTSNGPALLSVYTAPQGTNVTAGRSATFSTQVTGPVTPIYQWRFQGTNISQATDSSLTVNNVQITNVGPYSVVCAATGVSSTSAGAMLTVTIPQTNNPPGSTLAPVGLINWWPFDGNFSDIYGSNNASPVNGVTFVPSEVGYGCSFDGGSTTFLSLNASPVQPPWTVSLWINRLNVLPSTSGAVSDAIIGDSATSLKLEQYNGTRKVGITRFGTGGVDYVFNYSVPTNTWTHLVVVSTTTNTSVYANGVFQDSMTNTIPLGRGQIGADFGGAIDNALATYDELMIFNRALDPSEILSLYNAGPAGVLRAPEFISTSTTADTGFESTIRGLTGKTLSVYGSSNLVDWAFLNTTTNTNGLVPFTDSLNNAAGARFYKATQQ